MLTTVHGGPGAGSNAHNAVSMEGWLRKRGSRYKTTKQWNERYFVLRGAVLSYYVHRTDPQPKHELLLQPQCFVTDIAAESKDKNSKHSNPDYASTVGGASSTAPPPSAPRDSSPPSTPSKKESKKGNKDSKTYYSFRIVWPVSAPVLSSSSSLVGNAAPPLLQNGSWVAGGSDEERSMCSIRSVGPLLNSNTAALNSARSTDDTDFADEYILANHNMSEGRTSPPQGLAEGQQENRTPPSPGSPSGATRHSSWSGPTGNGAVGTRISAPPNTRKVIQSRQRSHPVSQPQLQPSNANEPQHQLQSSDHADSGEVLVESALPGSVGQQGGGIEANSSHPKKHKKTKKMLLLGSKVAVASGALVTATVLTSGVGLAAGLTFVGISAAAGGSGAVASRTYFRSKKNSGITLVLSTSSLEEATKWKAALEAAILNLVDDGISREVHTDGDSSANSRKMSIAEPSTWANLFAMDGHNPQNALIPTATVQHEPTHEHTTRGTLFTGGTGREETEAESKGTIYGLYAHPATRWRPVEGGWASFFGMGASGLRIYEEETPPSPKQSAGKSRLAAPRVSVKGRPCPPLKAQIILDATPVNAFMCLMSYARAGRQGSGDTPDMTPGSYQRSCFRIVETIDDHSDVIHVVFRPLYLFPSWTAPRDYCLMRYWRFEEDGSYAVCLDSVRHRNCPPNPAYVRGELHGVYTIAPLKSSSSRSKNKKKGSSYCSSHPQCLLTHIVQVDPRGWVPTIKLPQLANQGYAEAFAVSALLQILDVRDALTNDRFVSLMPSEGYHGDRSEEKKLIESLGQQQLSSNLHTTESEDDEGQLALMRSAESADEGNDQLNYDFSYSALERVHSIDDLSILNDEASTDDKRSTPAIKHLMPSVPEPLHKNMWAEPDANSFMVRGQSYLKDKKKVHAGASMFRLIAMDIVEVSALMMKSMCAHPKERVQLALARERESPETADMPAYIFCINITLPGPPHYHILVYYAADDMSMIDGSDGTPFSLLASKFFFGDSDEFRDNTFKLIPQIVEGNFIVRKAVGSTPAIMGTKLKQHYFSGERYFEVLLDVASSSVAAGVVRLCIGYAKTLVVDLAFLFEGVEQRTLPERVLGCARLKNVDFSKRIRFTDQYEDE